MTWTQVGITPAKWFCAGYHQGEALMIKHTQKNEPSFVVETCVILNWVEAAQSMGNYMTPGHGQ